MTNFLTCHSEHYRNTPLLPPQPTTLPGDAQPVTLQINGRKVAANSQENVVQAAARNGITIPTLCYHPDLSPVGSCRLCVVDVAGHDNLVPACMTRCHEGQVVSTESPRAIQARKLVLELLLQDYCEDPKEKTPGRRNELLHWAEHYGAIRPDDFPAVPRYSLSSDPHPFLRVNLNQCILCTRCIRACAEVQGRFIWNLAGRGEGVHIAAGLGTSMLEAGCESCGACATYCPTGAIEDRTTLNGPDPDRTVRTTCGYCGVGCQFDLNVRDNRILGVASSPDAPVNGMSLCVKGRYGYGFVHHADRLTTPQVRQYLLEGKPKPEQIADRGPWVDVDWETSLRIVALRLVQIASESGPQAFGVMASAKCTNEENYLLQKLARQVLLTGNIDHCARLCHSSTVAGLGMAFGSGAMSNSMDDLAQQAAAFFVIGSNTTEQHPVFGTMLRQAVMRRGAKLLVADPRRIDLCDFATLHIRQRPGTDAALLNGLMHIIVESGRLNQAFIDDRCEEFAPFRENLRNYPPAQVAAITGISEPELRQAADLLTHHHPLAVIWAMGITQHTSGVLNVLSLANLQMLLGNMGIAGGGVNPLRGQNNVQGSCDMGALPDVFPGYQSVTNLAVAAKFAAAWQCSGVGLPASWRPGLTLTEMLRAAETGDVRALYILGEDPALTEPDSGHARKCLERAEFIVLQEILSSETAPYADVLLPGAAFAEKEGTFTNTERRVQLVRQAIAPPGRARQDWQVIADLATRILALRNRQPLGPQAGWMYTGPAQILREISALTPIYSGITYERLESGARLQWPVPDEQHPGTPILHVGKFTRGKGRFHTVDHLPPRELPDREFPLLLTTGRILSHWHGGELTRRVPGLMEICGEALVEINPADANRFSVAHGDLVILESRRGRMAARACVGDRVPQGIVFANFHFPGMASANNLTLEALDPVAKIPEYKVCAVTLRRA
jgi:formate dehydrogenase alpha subunit